MTNEPQRRAIILQRALDHMGFEVENTGGTAYQSGRIMVTGTDYELPGLTDPVFAWVEYGDEHDGDGEMDRHETFADALLDIYGPCEGETLPEPVWALRPYATKEGER